MHLDIKYWLSQLKLSQYEALLAKYGGVEDILHMDEEAIKILGIRNGAHRAKIVSSLDVLRAKFYSKASGGKKKSTALKDFFRNRLRPVDLQSTMPNIGRMENVAVHAQNDKLKELRRQLEWELSQDGRQLESHAWYHGPIPRSHAELLLNQNGDFLIRDSTSGSVGNLVLSIFWKGSHLHFIITKVIVQPHTVYERTQYRLEDELFHSIPDLVTCYVGNGKVITAATGAKITTPINRQFPLSYYSNRYGNQSTSSAGHYATKLECSLANMERLSIDPALPNVPLKTRPGGVQYSTQSLPRPSAIDKNKLMRMPSDPSINSPDNGTVAAVAQSKLAPPKPSRVSFQNETDVAEHLHDEQKASLQVDLQNDSIAKEHAKLDTGLPHVKGHNEIELTSASLIEESRVTEYVDSPDGRVTIDEMVVKTPLQATTLPRIKTKQNAQRPTSQTCNLFSQGHYDFPSACQATLVGNQEDDSAMENDREIGSCDDNDKTPTFSQTAPPLPITTDQQMSSLFDCDNFQTILLPAIDNKPLDMTTMESISSLFEEHSPKSMALHLLHSDLDVLGIAITNDKTLFNYQDNYCGMHVGSGIELCTLPHGQQLRYDLIERTQCLRLFVAITILTCSSVDDRVAMLNHWIQIAIETKTALGNMYGFSSILQALSLPQIARLSTTWHLLRQRHTETAYTFEARLRPLTKLMSDGTNPHAPNTTIPDLHSATLLWQASLDSFLDEGVSISRLGVQLANSTANYGCDLLWNHMNLIRSWSLNLPLYLRNSRNALENVQMDALLLDMFRTEFHVKFLWGCRGANAQSDQRYEKFEQVLTAFSERCE